MANQSPRDDVVTSYKDAPTSTVSAGGVIFAYRELGPRSGVSLVFTTWEPTWMTGTPGSSTGSLPGAT